MSERYKAEEYTYYGVGRTEQKGWRVVDADDTILIEHVDSPHEAKKIIDVLHGETEKLHARVRELEAENAVLTERAHDALANAVEHENKVGELEAANERLRDAGKWVLYATIHGISQSGGEATQAEKEHAIEALKEAVDEK